MGLFLIVSMVPLLSLLCTLVAKGGRVLSFHFLTAAWQPVGERGGIAHAIVGSACLLLVASLFAVPLGLANGLYLARCGNHRWARFVRTLLDVMSGLPAILVGVFVYMVVVRRMGFSLHLGFSMLAGSLALSIIMLPIFARTTEEAFRAIPRTVDEAGLALGLPRRRVLLRIVLRAAAPAVLTGLFLSLARVGGEAAPLLFTAFGSNELPRSPLKPAGSLPHLLFDYARQPFQELVQQAWGAALVLVIMILSIRLATHAYTHWRYQPGHHA
jgi:phosphate transport system permease protein